MVTTATDVTGRFPVDDWAARNGWAISSLGIAMAYSAAILAEDLPRVSDFRGLRRGQGGFGPVPELA